MLYFCKTQKIIMNSPFRKNEIYLFFFLEQEKGL